MIITLVLSLLSLVAVVLITTFVYLAGDEIQLLFELPEVDSRIFRQELTQTPVLISFLIQALVCFACIKLITTPSGPEMWFYFKPKWNMF